MMSKDTILINRAPVLTLWAATVADAHGSPLNGPIFAT